MKYVTMIGDKQYVIELLDDNHVLVDNTIYDVDFDAISDQPVYSMIVDGKSYEAYMYPSDEGWQVLLQGRLYSAVVEDEREMRLRAAAGGSVADRGDFHLKAPMPGLVVSVPVEDGQDVQKGDVLLILESMKMQNELKSPRNGKVARLRVKVGDSVEQRQTLLSVI